MSISSHGGVALGIAMAFQLWSSATHAACTSDVECKGDRICIRGRCADPPKTRAAKAASPAATSLSPAPAARAATTDAPAARATTTDAPAARAATTDTARPATGGAAPDPFGDEAAQASLVVPVAPQPNPSVSVPPPADTAASPPAPMIPPDAQAPVVPPADVVASPPPITPAVPEPPSRAALPPRPVYVAPTHAVVPGRRGGRSPSLSEDDARKRQALDYRPITLDFMAGFTTTQGTTELLIAPGSTSGSIQVLSFLMAVRAADVMAAGFGISYASTSDAGATYKPKCSYGGYSCTNYVAGGSASGAGAAMYIELSPLFINQLGPVASVSYYMGRFSGPVFNLGFRFRLGPLIVMPGFRWASINIDYDDGDEKAQYSGKGFGIDLAIPLAGAR